MAAFKRRDARDFRELSGEPSKRSASQVLIGATLSSAKPRHLTTPRVGAIKCPLEVNMTDTALQTRLRQTRETTVKEHVDAENRHDPTATVATFSHSKASYDIVPCQN
jgi:hypothetical protein